MSSVLQQVEQRLLAEAYKGDAERDDALMRLLEAVIKALQGTAGEAVLLLMTAFYLHQPLH